MITINCKIQKVLKVNMSAMSDRGFKGIETILLQKGSKLCRPPSATKDQMSKKDVLLTKQIASLRIHVERESLIVLDTLICVSHM